MSSKADAEFSKLRIISKLPPSMRTRQFMGVIVVLVVLVVCLLVYNKADRLKLGTDGIDRLSKTARAYFSQTVDSPTIIQPAILKPHVDSNLIDMSFCDGDPLCDGSKLTVTDKENNTQMVRTCLDENPICMIMVYAPWCKHCHTALPIVKESASIISSMPVVIINSEMIKQSLLSDISVTHFPFIAATSDSMASSNVLDMPVTLPNLKNLAETQIMGTTTR